MNKNGQDTFAINPDCKVKIKVKNELCVSAATCIIHAPNTFDLDEESVAYVKEGTWDEAINIIRAAKSCPTSAIVVEDMDGNQLWPEIKAD